MEGKLSRAAPCVQRPVAAYRIQLPFSGGVAPKKPSVKLVVLSIINTLEIPYISILQNLDDLYDPAVIIPVVWVSTHTAKIIERLRSVWPFKLSE